MIEVTGLSKKYGKHIAVRDVDFTIRDGEIIGFLGPNGAGKSTIMNILTGYLSPTTGSAKIDGYDILENPKEAKKRIGYLPEIPPLYLDMTVREYLHFVYGLKKVTLPEMPHLDEICRLVKVEDVQHRLIKNLSKGYRQRVGIAQALVGNPDVLILDEPTVGLDPKQIIEIRSLITQLGKHHTVILSSHILSEIQAVCQRIIIINKGRLIADDTTENLSKTMSEDHSMVARIVGPKAEIRKALTSIRGVASVDCLGQRESGSNDYHIQPEEGADVRAAIFQRMSERKYTVLMMKTNELTLEQIFLQLTERDMDFTLAPKAEPAAGDAQVLTDAQQAEVEALADELAGPAAVEADQNNEEADA